MSFGIEKIDIMEAYQQKDEQAFFNLSKALDAMREDIFKKMNAGVDRETFAKLDALNRACEAASEMCKAKC